MQNALLEQRYRKPEGRPPNRYFAHWPQKGLFPRFRPAFTNYDREFNFKYKYVDDEMKGNPNTWVGRTSEFRFKRAGVGEKGMNQKKNSQVVAGYTRRWPPRQHAYLYIPKNQKKAQELREKYNTDYNKLTEEGIEPEYTGAAYRAWRREHLLNQLNYKKAETAVRRREYKRRYKYRERANRKYNKEVTQRKKQTAEEYAQIQTKPKRPNPMEIEDDDAELDIPSGPPRPRQVQPFYTISPLYNLPEFKTPPPKPKISYRELNIILSGTMEDLGNLNKDEKDGKFTPRSSARVKAYMAALAKKKAEQDKKK